MVKRIKYLYDFNAMQIIKILLLLYPFYYNSYIIFLISNQTLSIFDIKR